MPRLKVALMGAAASVLCTLLLLSTAYARADQRASQSFDIRPQSLSAALTEFARQSHEEILFAPEIVAQKHSVGVHGTMQPLAALAILLKASGLPFNSTPSGAILVGVAGTNLSPNSTAEVASSNVGAGDPQQEGKRSSSGGFRVAQLDPAANSQPSSVGSNTSTEQQSPKEPARLDEIVVTAQKRAENLQNVPISIRALGEAELDRAGAQGLEGFAGLAPSLSLIGQGPLRQQIAMRGVAIGDLRFDRPEVRETVGLYLDETPISTQIVSPNLGLLDIERIEVLRGPQGTLYGAGSLSGTVRMITHRPDLNSLQLSGDSTVSSTNHGTTNYIVSAIVNAPISEGAAAVRLVGYHRDDGGFIDDLSTGRNNINFTHEDSGRISLRIRPGDRLTIDGTVVYQQTHLGGDFSYRAEAGDLNELTLIPEPSNSRIVLPSIVAAYDLGHSTLTNVLSYFKKDTDFTVDSGGFADLLIGAPNPIDGPNVTTFHQGEYTEELRLSSNQTGRFTYTVGAFFQHQNNGFSQNVTLPGFDEYTGVDSTGFGANRDQIYASQIDLTTNQYALFGEISVIPVDHLTLTAGGRGFKVSQHSTVIFDGLLAEPQVGQQHFSFDASGFNPKVNVSYQVSKDELLYVQASKGFRLGGTNEPVPADLCATDLAGLGLQQPPPSFKSDTLWNYELGAKTAWADGRVTVNTALYYIDWKNPPLSADFNCGFSTEISAGDFKIPGAEIDIQARPVDALTIRAGASYNDGHLSGDLPVLGGRDGDRVPQTPKATFNAGIDYEFPFRSAAGARSFIHADYRYTGDRVTSFPNSPSYNGYYNLPHYSLVGLRVGLIWAHFNVEAFADNVFDTRANLNETRFYRAYDKIPGTSIATNRPRTIGLELGFSY